MSKQDQLDAAIELGLADGATEEQQERAAEALVEELSTEQGEDGDAVGESSLD